MQISARRLIVVFIAIASGYVGFLLASFLALHNAPPISDASQKSGDAVQPTVQTRSAQTPQPETVASSTPTPSAAPAATPPKRLAPQGVFFLRERVSVVTDDAIVGVNAGAKVLMLERLENGNLKVTDGPDDFDVSPEMLTNDLDLAEMIVRRDQAAQQALALRKQQQRLQLQQQQAALARQTASAQVPASPAPRATPLPQPQQSAALPAQQQQPEQQQKQSPPPQDQGLPQQLPPLSNTGFAPSATTSGAESVPRNLAPFAPSATSSRRANRTYPAKSVDQPIQPELPASDSEPPEIPQMLQSPQNETAPADEGR